MFGSGVWTKYVCWIRTNAVVSSAACCGCVGQSQCKHLYRLCDLDLNTIGIIFWESRLEAGFSWTKKIPNRRNGWGFWVRYKGLPGCLSTYELCVYCSCCTNTLSHLCQDTLSEPASVQIHLFFKFNIVSWLNFCLCAYSHRFFRNNSVIQIYV